VNAEALAVGKGRGQDGLSTEFGERQLRNSLNDGAVGGSCLRGGSMSINYWRAKALGKGLGVKRGLSQREFLNTKAAS